MRELRFDRRFLWVLAVGIAAVDLLVILYGLIFGFHHMRRENGLLEVAQLVALAVAGVGFGALILRLRHGGRIVASGAAVMCVMFFFREFETPLHNPLLDFMSSDPFLWILAAVFGLFLAVQIYLNWAHVPAFLGWLVRFQWWPWLFGGSLLLIGSAFEAMHLAFMEELFELNGDVVFALIAVTALGRSLRAANAHVPALHAH